MIVWRVMAWTTNPDTFAREHEVLATRSSYDEARAVEELLNGALAEKVWIDSVELDERAPAAPPKPKGRRRRRK